MKMKNLALILLTIAVTFVVMKGCASYNGTRAKSDDRSDTRTLRKQYDDVVIKLNDSLSTVKAQANAIKRLSADNESQNAVISTKNATINAKTVLIGKLTRQLSNSQAYGVKLEKKLKIASKPKKRRKSTKKKISNKPVKSSRQIAKEKKYKKLLSYKNSIKNSLKKLDKKLKYANQIIGKKQRKKAVGIVKKEIYKLNRSLRGIEYEISRLR